MIVLWLLGLLLFAYLLYVCVPLRIAFFHPVHTVLYGLVDTYVYFRHKMYNWCNAGQLACYSAHFGGGKTLSIVHYVCAVFNRYNNKPVFDRGSRSFVTQKIHVISNVDFTSIPYEKLESLSQVVACAYRNRDIDKKNGTRTVVLCVIDEASAQLNSRQFKTNIDPTFLNTLITSRHYHISILYSSQKFKLTDALMRAVTQKVINCKKVWRLLVQFEYDADEMEFASDPSAVRPKRRTGFFVTNGDYQAYDTLAVVGKLKKSVDEGDMMSEQEILDMRGNINPDNDLVRHPSKSIKRQRKLKKVS